MALFAQVTPPFVAGSPDSPVLPVPPPPGSGWPHGGEEPDTIQTQRFELRVSKAFLRILDFLVGKEIASSRADIVRRAVALYALARKNQEEGLKIAFVSLGDSNQVIVKDIISI
jgi:hypothetical protein